MRRVLPVITDFALMHLQQPFHFRKNVIEPIALNTNVKNEDLIGRNVRISGWGITETGLNPNLKQTTMKVAFIQGTHVLMLSRKNGTSTCAGDSGGNVIAK